MLALIFVLVISFSVATATATAPAHLCPSFEPSFVAQQQGTGQTGTLVVIATLFNAKQCIMKSPNSRASRRFVLFLFFLASSDKLIFLLPTLSLISSY